MSLFMSTFDTWKLEGREIMHQVKCWLCILISAHHDVSCFQWELVYEGEVLNSTTYQKWLIQTADSCVSYYTKISQLLQVAINVCSAGLM